MRRRPCVARNRSVVSCLRRWRTARRVLGEEWRRGGLHDRGSLSFKRSRSGVGSWTGDVGCRLDECRRLWGTRGRRCLRRRDCTRVARHRRGITERALRLESLKRPRLREGEDPFRARRSSHLCSLRTRRSSHIRRLGACGPTHVRRKVELWLSIRRRLGHLDESLGRSLGLCRSSVVGRWERERRCLVDRESGFESSVRRNRHRLAFVLRYDSRTVRCP